MLCLFLSALDNAIVATAMPRIIDDLKGMTYYSLPFTTYLLFSTVAIPVAGKLSDVFGRKRIVLWGIISFLISSALCALSVDMLMLILARGGARCVWWCDSIKCFYYYSGTFSCKGKG